MIWLRIAQGVLCAVEVCGLYFLFHLFFDLRFNQLLGRLILWTTGILLCCLTIYQREVGGMYSRYYMFICIFISICVGSIFYKVKILEVSFVSSLYYVITYFFDLLFGYLGEVLFDIVDLVIIVQAKLTLERVIVMLISRILIVAAMIYIVQKKSVLQRIFSKYRVIFWSFVFHVYTGLYFCEKIFYTPYRVEGKTDVYFVIFPVFVIFFFVIIVMYIMYIEKKNEIQLVNNQNEMIEKNYQEMILLYQKRERVFHDMKNHLSVLALLLSEKDINRAENYISKINEPILELEHKKYTGNRIVDIILADKAEKAQHHNINFEIKANTIEEGRIQDIDWCSILANLLDNSIEACIKLNEEDRWIKLILNQNDCAIIIDISNAYNGVISKSNGFFESSKPEKYLHGLGMMSIKSSVEKYNGIMECKCEMNIFKINISLFY